MAAVSLFWNTNMAAVTSCENTLYILLQFITFIDAQRLNCLSFVDKVGLKLDNSKVQVRSLSDC